MKLSKKQFIIVSFMLFSLFFGAGNLIFPPFLGNEAGSNTPLAMLGFLVTAVVLPVLGVIIIAKFNGLDKLAGKVNRYFAVIFTIIILLSIGPGLGIPRAASVPFEMAILPLIGKTEHKEIYMALYSLIFFAIALWVSLTPSKLPKRVGKFLTPALLLLLLVFFGAFIFKGYNDINIPQDGYKDSALLLGFIDGYQTMDTIAALNFGLVISSTLFGMGIKDNKDIVKNTTKTGICAGLILAFIYIMLAFMGMSLSNAHAGFENGALILSSFAKLLFGDAGQVILAIIFTLACLTTCIGLITSISNYFSTTFKKFKYTHVAIFITVVSFLICNLGLNMILSISIPVLNAIYPVSIVLILLGLFDKFYKDNKFIYPITIAVTGVVSVIFALDNLEVPLGFIHDFFLLIPGYSMGFGWVLFTVGAIILSLILGLIVKHKKQTN